jgi:hypothetical protein
MVSLRGTFDFAEKEGLEAGSLSGDKQYNPSGSEWSHHNRSASAGEELVRK